MQEIWKTINDFEGYIISNFGNLISLKNSQTKYLTKRINKKGMLNINLQEMVKVLIIKLIDW